MSTDQRYLLQMSHAISSGNCPPSLANREPGAMHHARWLTTANRILRLYVSQKKPTENLKKLVKFIANVYAPTWFDIKKNKSCVEGAKHLFKFIKRTAYLKGEDKKIVEKSIQQNGFFAHPENILLAMVYDDDLRVRGRAVNLLKYVSTTERQFVVPKINFKATKYENMVSWESIEITRPPLFSGFKELMNLKESPYGEEVRSIPCHSQAVERGVKLVTEASASVVESNRHGFILNTIHSRQKMPAFNTKKDFS